MNNKRLSIAETTGLVVLTVAAAAITVKLLGLILPVTPIILFTGVITLITLYGGMKAGLPCVIATVIVINYFFIAPLYSLTLAADDLFRLCAFGLSMALAIFIRRRERLYRI